VVTRPAAAKNIQFHCWGLALSPDFVSGDLAWTAPGEAACNEVAGVVVTDDNAIVESVDATDAVVAGAIAAFKFIFDESWITC
jgi:hypothetical protein